MDIVTYMEGVWIDIQTDFMYITVCQMIKLGLRSMPENSPDIHAPQVNQFLTVTVYYVA